MLLVASLFSIVIPDALQDIDATLPTSVLSNQELLHSYRLPLLLSSLRAKTLKLASQRKRQLCLAQGRAKRSRLRVCGVSKVCRLPLLEEKDKLYIPITLQGSAPVKAFLDTGSEICLISKNMFDQLPNKDDIPDAKVCSTIVDVNGKEVVQVLPPKLITFGTVSYTHLTLPTIYSV